MSKPRETPEQRAVRVANSRCGFWGMTPDQFLEHVAVYGGSRKATSPMSRYLHRRYLAIAKGHAFDISFLDWLPIWREPMPKKPRTPQPDCTHENLVAVLHYCPDTGVFTRKIRTGRSWPAGQVVGGFDKDSGYIKVGVLGRCFWAHRLAWMYVHGEFPDLQIDHKDGNRSNNAISNLRLATQSENNQNQRAPRGKGKVEPLGVSKVKGLDSYEANIKANGKQINLGRFSNVEDASAAYLRAKKELHPYQTIA